MLALASHREHPVVKLSLEDAIRMMEWARDIEPGNHLVAFTLARLYVETGMLQEAKALYNQINSPTDLPGLINTQSEAKSRKSAGTKPKK
jgi:thioredoxin-like negative regulator of GroEL